MKTVDFLTMGDSAYFETILISASQIARHHPKSRLYVYNWGFTEAQLRTLTTTKNIILIPWVLRMSPLLPKLGRQATIKKLLGINTMRDLPHVLFRAPKKILSAENFSQFYTSETYFFNKLLCIKDFIYQHANPFVFIDGDAFIINSLTEDFEDSPFDIGVTRRPQHELDYRKDHCHIVNSGVIFFLGSQEQRQTFVDAWHAKFLETREPVMEQTSLTRMLEHKKPSIFELAPSCHELTFNATIIRIGVLPCEQYNYNWIERFENEPEKQNIKILHFKSGRFKTPIFDKIAKTLNLTL